MVAVAWKTRAAPVLHVNTILQALYAVVCCSFEAAKSRDLSERTMHLSRLCKRHARSGPQNRRFYVLNFLRSSTMSWPTKVRTTLFSDRFLAMAKEYFGTDGIRGVPGTPPLDDATLYATGRSLGAYLKREHGAAHVLIGMDTRESGPHIASLLAPGLSPAVPPSAPSPPVTPPPLASPSSPT